MSERIAVLLGAGASRDAMLPLTEEFARRILESFDADLLAAVPHVRKRQQPIVDALHVVYGAMVAHATEQGKSALTAVNVERLVSAIRLLRDRRTHEAAPFVSSWRPSIESVDAHPLPFRDDDLREHFSLDSSFNFRLQGLADRIAAIAKATFEAGDGSTFRALEDQLLRKICSLLSHPADLTYLDPLIDLATQQPGGLDITTLNYDLTIETAAANRGVPVDTGLDRWQPGLPLRFEPIDGRVNLIKPHGSIDWERVSSSQRNRIEGFPLVRHCYRTSADPEAQPTWGTSSSPLIVIGDREKLETDGPTLALLHAFEESLHRASHLLIVGYSFGDEHVNTIVRNWMNADPRRTIAIVDPGWVTERMIIGPDTDPSFKEALMYTAGLPLKEVPGRIVVIRKGAREGLPEAITTRPLSRLENLIDIEVLPAPIAAVRITNPGYTLTRITARAWPEWKSNPLTPTAALWDHEGDQWVETLELADLARGETHEIRFDVHGDRPLVSIEINASSWAYTVREKITLDIPA
ncbi:MAG: hypothetical protein K0Q52_370 [Microbacterium sp.]|nr:hypothetical protein [Microbacterium sp.]